MILNLSLGTLRQLLRVSNEHFDDAMAVEHTIATLAATALRSPTNVHAIVALGGVDFIIRGMRRHPDVAAVQRQAALCVRNMTGRTPELRDVFLDAGAEHLLRAAAKLPYVLDEAYAALRELQCDVTMIKVTLMLSSPMLDTTLTLFCCVIAR